MVVIEAVEVVSEVGMVVVEVGLAVEEVDVVEIEIDTVVVDGFVVVLVEAGVYGSNWLLCLCLTSHQQLTSYGYVASI